jgi:hypothetical protein
MDASTKSYAYCSTNLNEFSENNLHELVSIMLNPKRSDKFLTNFKFVSKKMLTKKAANRKVFTEFLMGVSIDVYIRQLIKTKTFVNEFGRQKLGEFLMSSCKVELRMRKDVY